MLFVKFEKENALQDRLWRGTLRITGLGKAALESGEPVSLDELVPLDFNVWAADEEEARETFYVVKESFEEGGARCEVTDIHEVVLENEPTEDRLLIGGLKEARAGAFKKEIAETIAEDLNNFDEAVTVNG